MEKLLQQYQMRETEKFLKGHTKIASCYLSGYIQFPELSKGLLSYTDYILSIYQKLWTETETKRILHKIS